MDRYANFGYRMVTANALRHPDRLALTYAGTHHLTFADLESRSNRMAHALLVAGLEPGDRVASLLDDTLNVMDVYLAESKIGSVIAALNPFWRPELMQNVAAFSDATAFVYDARFQTVVDELRPQLPQVTKWLSLGVAPRPGTVQLEALLAHAPDTLPPLSGCYGDDWMYLYTSGTTGLPKAVVHSHASAMAVADIWTDVPRSERSLWGIGPIIYGAGFPSVVGCAFSGGMGVALENDFGPAAAIHVIERERITHLGMVVSFFTEMFRSRDHESVDLSSLEVVILGSEPLPPPLLERIKTRLPQVQLYSFYGSAEAMYTTFGRLDDGSQDLRSSGRARAGCAVKVVDQRGQRVIGEVGTLCHAGAHVMRGYLKQEALTESVLRDGWYVGEDLGVMHPDGTITVIGRRSDAIAVGDTWVQPGEIEAAAMAVPGVAEAGAVGVPEGGARQQILLAVAPIEGVTLREDDLHRALEAMLSAPLRPHRIVVADVLPHNEQAAAGTGKLLRSAIRDRWGQGLEAPSPLATSNQASA